MSESSVIKISSGQYHNMTFENGQYYTLNLLSNEYSFLQSISQNIWDIDMKSDKYHFGDIEIYARYVGKSRIDNSPLFAIDLASSIRKNKIDQIIN